MKIISLLITTISFLIVHTGFLEYEAFLAQAEIDGAQIRQDAEEEAARIQNARDRAIIEDYNEWALETVKKAYGWNHFTSRVIFWVVISMMTISLWLSYLQFLQEMEYRKHLINRTSKSDDNHEKKDERVEVSVTTLKLGGNGVEISSSLIGLLILGISFGFFLVYLTFVYPVTKSQQLPLPKQLTTEVDLLELE